MNKIIEEPNIGKSDSFYGDRSVVLSKKQLKAIIKEPLIGQLYISDIGFYPNARNHFRRRNKGIKEHILIYCIDGYGKIQIRNNTYELCPNAFFIINSHEPHSHWALENNPWSIYWLHFGGKRSLEFE
jgi:hypothetical protein